MKAVMAMVRAAPMGSTMAEKGFVLSDAGCLEGHGDDGPFGQILQGDAQRQGQGPGGADARQQALQRACFIPERCHYGHDLAAIFGIKDAVLIFIKSTARKVHAAGGSRDAAHFPACQKLLGLDHFQEDLGQDLRVHQIKTAFQLVHLTNTSVLTGNIIASGPLHCKRPDAFLSDYPVLKREVASCRNGIEKV